MAEITLKKILQDNWQNFLKKKIKRIPKEIRSDVIETVEKAMGCGSLEKGYTEYMCLECMESKKVGFTCKSKFCSRCGRIYVSKWVEKQEAKILDITHRHSVFTIPEELRDYLYRNRELLTELMDGVKEVINYWYKKHLKKEYEVGIICVLHTFGRDLKWNPHVHALVTEGAIDKNNKWFKSVNYIPYEFLRKSWQKVVLDIFKRKFKDYKTRKLISILYRKYKKGFYVNAERELKNAKEGAKYVGRYLGKPAIAEYRIMEYDGEKVTFWYMSHETKKKEILTLPVLDFIGRVIQHIQKKGFRFVRRYGLYSRRSNKLAQVIVDLYKFMKQMNIKDLLEKQKRRTLRKKSWKQRIIECFNKNPIECKKCKMEMELYRIWHHKYGAIYDFLEEIKHSREEINDNERLRERKTPRYGRGRGSVSLRDRNRREDLQISMFGVWI